jgi:uridine kinase
VLRDIAERGRDYMEVLKRFNRFVRKNFQEFVKPNMKHADIIIPGGANNNSNRILGYADLIVGLQFVLENLKNIKNKLSSSEANLEEMRSSQVLDKLLAP